MLNRCGIMIILIFTVNLFAQNQEWVARYDGPAHVVDGGLSVAVDNSGNVYITGRSADTNRSFECTTIKYDSAGNEIWIKKYHGPADSNYYDTGWGITIDDFGFIYVAAASRDSLTGDDFATIKYDSAGNELWVRRYGGPGNDYDWPWAIAADSHGNVYVTGRSVGSGTGFDYATVKYDSLGNEKWAKRYNGPGNGGDEPYSIAVDNYGNVHVTGTSTGAGTGLDFATIKYDSAGNELWVQRYNSSGEMDEFGTTLAIDGLGNVYITGGTWKFLQGIRSDYLTIKYDSAGNELWVKRYTGPGNQNDIPEAVVVYDNENIYVTGESFSSANRYNYYTIKYDSAGNEEWSRSYNGPGNDNDEPEAMSLDNRGNIYITGESRGTVDDDYATVVYDAQGNELTVQRYDGPNSGGAWQDVGFGVVADADGNFYVTGFSGGVGTCFDIATVKYSGISEINSTRDFEITQLRIYPNPFRDKTNIKFQMTDNSTTEIMIYDVTGRLVKDFGYLTNHQLPFNQILWSGTDNSGAKLPSGVYFLQLKTNDFAVAKKILFLR